MIDRTFRSIWILGCLSLLAGQAQAALRRFDLNITLSTLNPDCHNESYSALLVNGQFPAPAIRVMKGDDVEIAIHNLASSDVPTTIHYHGIRQYGTVESDGVPGVTQDPIRPGETFVQRFRVLHQSGTYFYHAHVGMQDDSVQGPFIVYEDERSIPELREDKTQKLVDGPHEYDDELTLQVSEWWHQSFITREAYYNGPDFVFDHGADSILMNGRTTYNMATASPDCQGYSALNVEPNKTYRLRVIGGNTFRTLGLAIKDHSMTIIEVDGEIVEPYEASYLELVAGQRFSVLLKTGDMAPGSAFAIATSYRHRHRGGGYTENGLGYLRYVEDGSKNKYSDFKPVSFAEEHAGAPVEREQGGRRGDGSGAGRPAEGGRPEGGRPEGGRPEGGRAAEGGRPEGGRPAEGGRPGGQGQGGEGRGGNGGGRGGGGGGRGGAAGRPAVPDEDRPDFPKFPVGDKRDWIWPKLVPLRPRDPMLDEDSDRTIMLRSYTTKLEDGRTRYLMNGRMPMERSTAIIHELEKMARPPTDFSRLATDGYDEMLNTFPLLYNETIDIVLQNGMSGTNCLVHPWHTHGHSHYVIATGEGEYVHEKDKDVRNYPNPLYKDVSTVYPSKVDETTKGCGWTKIRMRADNPGLWAIHCHVTSHMLQGKMAIFEEAPELIPSFRLYKD